MEGYSYGLECYTDAALSYSLDLTVFIRLLSKKTPKNKPFVYFYLCSKYFQAKNIL